MNPPALDDTAARRELIARALEMNASGLNQGTSGNLSVRCGEGLLITPSGIAYGELQPADIVAMTLDGRWQHALAPSSEWRLHRDIYAARPDVAAVVHAHPPHCTALALHGREIPPVHYMVAVSGGSTIRCAPYHTYGTPELSAAAVQALQGRSCCLLAHHGIVATGPSLARAMWVAVEMEALARQYLLALQVGEPPRLPEDEIARVVEKFRHYGLRDKA